MEVGRRTREEIVKWNQMTALRFHTGEGETSDIPGLPSGSKRRRRLAFAGSVRLSFAGSVRLSFAGSVRLSFAGSVRLFLSTLLRNTSTAFASNFSYTTNVQRWLAEKTTGKDNVKRKTLDKCDTRLFQSDSSTQLDVILSRLIAASLSRRQWKYAITYFEDFSSESISLSLPPPPFSGELRTQKLKSHLLRTQSLKILPSKPGVVQHITIQATLTARDFFLAHFCPSGPFNCTFSKTSFEFLLCRLWLTSVPV